MENKLESNPWYYKINGELIKKQKPCLVGDMVHLNNMDGCFKVHYVYVSNFVVMKKRKLVDVSWDNYKCHKGEGISKEAKIKRLTKSLNEANAVSSYILEELIKTIKK